MADSEKQIAFCLVNAVFS